MNRKPASSPHSRCCLEQSVFYKKKMRREAADLPSDASRRFLLLFFNITGYSVPIRQPKPPRTRSAPAVLRIRKTGFSEQKTTPAALKLRAFSISEFRVSVRGRPSSKGLSCPCCRRRVPLFLSRRRWIQRPPPFRRAWCPAWKCVRALPFRARIRQSSRWG